MANTTIALRSSGTAAATPSLGVLANGELSINYADGIIYYKTASNTLGSIRTTQPAGLTTEIQFNDAGTFGSNAALTFNKTAAQLNVTNLLVNTTLTTGAGAGGTIAGANVIYANNFIANTGGITTTGNSTLNGIVTVNYSFASGGNQNSAIEMYGANTKGGVGYFDFLSVNNGSTGTTNPSKWFRIGSNGELQIINSAYNNNLFNLNDSGYLTIPGALATSQYIQFSDGSRQYTANASLSNNQILAGLQTVSPTANITFDSMILANNNNGRNLRIGDDAWIGDINLSDTIAIRGAFSAANAYIVFGNADATALGRAGSGALTYGGNTVWHAGNDGAGSGLDADTLDGLHATSFANATFANTDYTTISATAGTYANTTYVPVITLAANGRVSNIVNTAISFPVTSVGGTTGAVSNTSLLNAIKAVDGAGSGLDADLLDGQSSAYYATAAHKYHSFSSGQYFYDSYEQGNYFRIFTENASYDTTRFCAIRDVEYYDQSGLVWTSWSAGETGVKNLLDGMQNTGMDVAHANRKFRFTVTKNTGYPTLALLVLYTTWTAITYPTTITITVEGATTANGGTWTTRETAVFNSSNTAANWGMHTKATSNFHNGESYARVTIDINDWTDSTTYTTIPLRNFSIFSNYAGSADSMQPFVWNYQKNVTFSNTPFVISSSNTVWHAGNDGAGSGLDADTLDGLHATSFANSTFANTDYTTISATAAVYGNASHVPVVTLTANGRVSLITNTAIAIASGAVSGLATSATTDTTNATNITTGTLGAARLPTVGTAGTYGNTTYVPVITTDLYGRVSAVTNTAISFPVTSVGGSTGAISNSQILSIITTVDGAGSGIDADLLDGLQSTSFANAAFANTRFASSGGSITGDVTVTGNLTIVGQTVYANTTSALIADNILTLNAAIGQASAPAANAGIEVDRGSSANTYLMWNEVTDKWQYTNDGTTYYDMADAGRLDSVYALANGTAGIANTDYTTISTTAGVYGNASYLPVVTLAANGRVSSITNTAIAIDAAAITSGTLSVARGGTGVTTSTGTGAVTLNTAPTITLPTINNIRKGYSTTATAAGTTTLTVNSNYYQFFTGTTTQILSLPAPQTMTLGMGFFVVNNSTGNIEVRASNSAAVATILAGTAMLFVSIDLTAGNGAAGWSAEIVGFSTITGTGAVVLNTSPTLSTPTVDRIDWPSTGYAPPSFTTRSVGTKLTVYPALSGSSVDYAIGINGGVLWSSIPEYNSSYSFKWYGGEIEVASLSGTGELTTATANIISTTASTSNTTGSLKVAGGVGVKGNVSADAINFPDGTRQTTAATGGASIGDVLALAIALG